MTNINEIIKMLEKLAEEQETTVKTCEIIKKPHAKEYFRGKAAGLRNAAALLRIATNNEIPFEV